MDCIKQCVCFGESDMSSLSVHELIYLDLGFCQRAHVKYCACLLRFVSVSFLGSSCKGNYI